MFVMRRDYWTLKDLLEIVKREDFHNAADRIMEGELLWEDNYRAMCDLNYLTCIVTRSRGLKLAFRTSPYVARYLDDAKITI